MPFTPAVPGFNASPAIGALPGVTNNNAGSVGSSVGNQLVVKSIYTYDPYAILANLFARHDQRPTAIFRFMLEALGMSRGVGAPTTGHYEEDRLVSTVGFGSIVTASTGPGTNVVLALAASSMYTYSPALTSNGTAAQASPVRVGDVIEFDSGKQAIVTVKNTSVNPHRITVRPLKAAVDLAGSISISAGVTYSVFTNLSAEATGLPDGMLPRIFLYTNTFAIVKEGYGVSGTALTDTLFVQRAGAENGTIEAILKLQAVDRFERSVSNTLLFGQQADNVSQFVPATSLDTPISSTEGLLSFGLTLGHIPTYTSGNYTLTDFDNISRILQAEGAGTNELLTLLGTSTYLQIENTFFNYTTTTNILPSLMVDKAKRAGYAPDSWEPFEDQNFNLYVGYKGVRKGGFDFMFLQMPEWTDPTLGGNSVYTYNQWAVTLPVGETKDLRTGQPSFMMGYEYKQSGAFNRRAVLGTYAGVGANFAPFGGATNEFDLARAGMVAEIAFHGASPNKVVIQRPA